MPELQYLRDALKQKRITLDDQSQTKMDQMLWLEDMMSDLAGKNKAATSEGLEALEGRIAEMVQTQVSQAVNDIVSGVITAFESVDMSVEAPDFSGIEARLDSLANREMPVPEKTDLGPLMAMMEKPKEPQKWDFECEYDRNGKLVNISAIPEGYYLEDDPE